MSARRPAAGFTLIEVLVALIVLSVAVVATLQLFGGGLRLARGSTDHLAATLLASEKLSEIALDAVEEGTTEGTDGAYHWTRRVAIDPALLPEDPEPGKTISSSPVRLARISVQVRWGTNRHVELVTLRALGSTP